MTGLTATQTQLTDRLLLSLARELAMDIVDTKVVAANHEITLETLETITKLPYFQNLYIEQKRLWDSALNTKERAQLRALSMVEEALPEMWRRLHEPGDFTTARVELFKTLARIGGLGEKNDVGSAEKVQITINMGETSPGNPSAITIDAQAIPTEDDP